jgi:hypothetical protein
MNDPIDLQQNDDMNGASPMIGGDQDYPQVTLNNPDLVNFPNSGKAVIQHEVTRREHFKKDNGKHGHKVTLKIKSIRPMGRKRNSFKNNSAEGAMRDMMGDE